MIKPEELKLAAHWLQVLRNEVGKAVVGQPDAVDQMLIALVASGHVLIEGVPGLGKTLLVRTLAQGAGARSYARVQFTPDLMPSDITGHCGAGRHRRGPGALRVVRGPVFTNLLLADEINRAPAKTQSALLEVMQEYQVTLEGQALTLPQPFMVLATQNPVDTEGTYPLPEAQLDRFLLQDPTSATRRTTKRRRSCAAPPTAAAPATSLPLDGVSQPVLDDAQVLELQRLVASACSDGRQGDRLRGARWSAPRATMAGAGVRRRARAARVALDARRRAPPR